LTAIGRHEHFSSGGRIDLASAVRERVAARLSRIAGSRGKLPHAWYAAALTLVFLVAAAAHMAAQAVPVASRRADAQVGLGYTLDQPSYVQQTYQGLTAYGDFDLNLHLGIEAEFHQANSRTGDKSYQRTYEIGGRYFRTYGPLVPYVKGMVGRGDYIYPTGQTGVAYNMFAAGAGADFKLSTYLRLRGEYEFQKWTSFQNGGLTPHLITIGIAYHFAGKPRYR
jgi:opacity protein-like surface antigen